MLIFSNQSLNYLLPFKIKFLLKVVKLCFKYVHSFFSSLLYPEGGSRSLPTFSLCHPSFSFSVFIFISLLATFSRAGHTLSFHDITCFLVVLSPSSCSLQYRLSECSYALGLGFSSSLHVLISYVISSILIALNSLYMLMICIFMSPVQKSLLRFRLIYLPGYLTSLPGYLSSVQSLSCVQFLATPWTAVHQAFLSITNSQSLLKLMSIEWVMPSNHLILCCLLLLLPSIFLSISVFSNESVLRIRWPKYWSFSFNIKRSNEYLGLISFRMDWLDLLAVQGTLKSLLQNHSSKASILQHSAFFIVQLSHPYMTTGKTIDWIRWTFMAN